MFSEEVSSFVECLTTHKNLLCEAVYFRCRVAAAKDDAAKDDAAKNDAAKNDAAKNDAAKNDAAKNDAAKNDAANTTPSTINRTKAQVYAACTSSTDHPALRLLGALFQKHQNKFPEQGHPPDLLCANQEVSEPWSSHTFSDDEIAASQTAVLDMIVNLLTPIFAAQVALALEKHHDFKFKKSPSWWKTKIAQSKMNDEEAFDVLANLDCDPAVVITAYRHSHQSSLANLPQKKLWILYFQACKEAQAKEVAKAAAAKEEATTCEAAKLASKLAEKEKAANGNQGKKGPKESFSNVCAAQHRRAAVASEEKGREMETAAGFVTMMRELCFASRQDKTAQVATLTALLESEPECTNELRDRVKTAFSAEARLSAFADLEFWTKDFGEEAAELRKADESHAGAVAAAAAVCPSTTPVAQDELGLFKEAFSAAKVSQPNERTITIADSKWYFYRRCTTHPWNEGGSEIAVTSVEQLRSLASEEPLSKEAFDQQMREHDELKRFVCHCDATPWWICKETSETITRHHGEDGFVRYWTIRSASKEVRGNTMLELRAQLKGKVQFTWHQSEMENKQSSQIPCGDFMGNCYELSPSATHNLQVLIGESGAGKSAAARFEGKGGSNLIAITLSSKHFQRTWPNTPTDLEHLEDLDAKLHGMQQQLHPQKRASFIAYSAHLLSLGETKAWSQISRELADISADRDSVAEHFVLTCLMTAFNNRDDAKWVVVEKGKLPDGQMKVKVLLVIDEIGHCLALARGIMSGFDRILAAVSHWCDLRIRLVGTGADIFGHRCVTDRPVTNPWHTDVVEIKMKSGIEFFAEKLKSTPGATEVAALVVEKVVASKSLSALCTNCRIASFFAYFIGLADVQSATARPSDDRTQMALTLDNALHTAGTMALRHFARVNSPSEASRDVRSELLRVVQWQLAQQAWRRSHRSSGAPPLFERLALTFDYRVDGNQIGTHRLDPSPGAAAYVVAKGINSSSTNGSLPSRPTALRIEGGSSSPPPLAATAALADALEYASSAATAALADALEYASKKGLVLHKAVGEFVASRALQLAAVGHMEVPLTSLSDGFGMEKLFRHMLMRSYAVEGAAVLPLQLDRGFPNGSTGRCDFPGETLRAILAFHAQHDTHDGDRVVLLSTGSYAPFADLVEMRWGPKPDNRAGIRFFCIKNKEGGGEIDHRCNRLGIDFGPPTQEKSCSQQRRDLRTPLNGITRKTILDVFATKKRVEVTEQAADGLTNRTPGDDASAKAEPNFAKGAKVAFEGLMAQQARLTLMSIVTQATRESNDQDWPLRLLDAVNTNPDMNAIREDFVFVSAKPSQELEQACAQLNKATAEGVTFSAIDAASDFHTFENFYNEERSDKKKCDEGQRQAVLGYYEPPFARVEDAVAVAQCVDDEDGKAVMPALEERLRDWCLGCDTNRKVIGGEQ